MSEKSKRGKRNRTSGNNYERQIAILYRESGYVDAATSRAESRNLDSCKVDIANIPLYPQCKYGYKSMSVNNYIQLFNEMDALIKEKKLNPHPYVIHHRKGRTAFQDLVIMPKKHYFDLLKQINKIN